MAENRSRGETILEFLEGLQSFTGPGEMGRGSFGHGGQWSRNAAEVSYKPPVEIGKPQESLQFL